MDGQIGSILALMLTTEWSLHSSDVIRRWEEQKREREGERKKMSISMWHLHVLSSSLRRLFGKTHLLFGRNRNKFVCSSCSTNYPLHARVRVFHRLPKWLRLRCVYRWTIAKNWRKCPTLGSRGSWHCTRSAQMVCRRLHCAQSNWHCHRRSFAVGTEYAGDRSMEWSYSYNIRHPTNVLRISCSSIWCDQSPISDRRNQNTVKRTTAQMQRIECKSIVNTFLTNWDSRTRKMKLLTAAEHQKLTENILRIWDARESHEIILLHFDVAIDPVIAGVYRIEHFDKTKRNMKSECNLAVSHGSLRWSKSTEFQFCTKFYASMAPAIRVWSSLALASEYTSSIHMLNSIHELDIQPVKRMLIDEYTCRRITWARDRWIFPIQQLRNEQKKSFLFRWKYIQTHKSGLFRIYHFIKIQVTLASHTIA